MTNPPAPDNYQPPQAPAYPPNGSTADTYPGKTLGIVALVLAIVANVIGMILGIVALVQSRKAGRKNLPAVWAIIVGAVLFVVGIIVFAALVTLLAGIAAQCGDLGPGTHLVNGVTYTCG